MIRLNSKLGVFFFALFFMAGVTFAADTVTQTVTYEVPAINEISVSNAAVALAVTAPVAGVSTLVEGLDSSTSYSITTNGTGMRITASIPTIMPAGVTLEINLPTPTGGTSAGWITLDTTVRNLVTAISQLAEGPLAISYRLRATLAAGVVASANRIVTLTVIQ